MIIGHYEFLVHILGATYVRTYRGGLIKCSLGVVALQNFRISFYFFKYTLKFLFIYFCLLQIQNHNSALTYNYISYAYID
jgi:hypothetical protein